VRLRTLGVALGSILTVTGWAAPPALAGGTSTSVAGGASAGPIPTSASGGSSPSSPTRSSRHAHHAPITAKSPNITYEGPVYERTASGQLVPYTQPAATVSQTDSATAGAVAGGSEVTGGSTPGLSSTTKPELLVPGHTARIVEGIAAAPIDAPASVQQIIWSGNQIVGLPYIYGGGHASFVSPGYDCSGTVSYALHGASLLSAPEDSSELEGLGAHGVGEWVTVFANPGHAYMDVAGLRLDTSAADDPSNQQGPRWRPLRQGNRGYRVRHPVGL
jgi:cell wall-associated NlpC family hydrolase